MSRSGYTDDCENFAMWRGQVASAIRGKRGQAFLRELVEALDSMPEKRLIEHELWRDGEVCALGCVGAKRGIAGLADLDPYDYDLLADRFGIAHQLIREIEWVNDEAGQWLTDTPETRWQRVREWALRHTRG